MTEAPPLFLTKQRLTKWGTWYNCIISMGLGYTRHSLIARMEKEGVLISSTLKQLAPNNPEAEEVNDLIEYLASKEGVGKPQLAKVIRIHYTEQEKNMHIKIQISGVSKRTYYNYLEEAEVWISEQLLIN